MKTSIVGFAFLVAPAIAANAAEFTGPRVEARVGWDRYSQSRVSGATARLPSAERPDGVSYGISAGYDHALNDSVIVGVEAGLDLFDNNAKGTAGNIQYQLKARRDLEAAVRVGTRLTDNLLAYGKVGYSNARFRSDLKISGTTGTSRVVINESLDGLRVGAGLQQALGGNVYTKVEYRYSDYQQGVNRHQVVAGVGLSF